MTGMEVSETRLTPGRAAPRGNLRRLHGLTGLGLVTAALALLGLGFVRTQSSLVAVVDGVRHDLHTHAPTVGAVLRQAGLELYPEDRVSPGLDEPLRSGLVIAVERARPVRLHADGQTHLLRTHAQTIGELIGEAGLLLGPADELWWSEAQGEADPVLVGLRSPLLTTTARPRTTSSRGGSHGFSTSPTSPSRTPVVTEGNESRVSASPTPFISVRRATTLTLDDGGITRTLHTTLETVGQVLEEQGVVVYLADRVAPGFAEPLAPGMTIAIERSIPAQIEVDGRTIHTRTRAESVAGLLAQEQIALVGKDQVVPDLEAPVAAHLVVRVTRVREELLVEFEPIPFETIWVGDPEVEIDQIRMAQDGQIGLTKRRYRIVYENDQEVERFLEDSWSAQPPITKTMAYGTKIVVRTLETADGPIEYWRKMRVYTTSYRASSAGKPPDHPRYGYTRLGIFLTKGIIAVDPTVIPLRSRVYIPGYGVGLAADTGGGVKAKFVDLGFDEHNYQSWHWWTDVYLMTPVPKASQIKWVLPDWPRYPDRRR